MHEPDPIRVVAINIARGRLRARISVAPAFRHTDAALAQAVLAVHPSLAHHACKNAEGPHFDDVIDHTSTPHLLEHLIIDAQLRDASTPLDRTFTGWTQWSDEANGIADVEVSFASDMVAMRALDHSVATLNRMLADRP